MDALLEAAQDRRSAPSPQLTVAPGGAPVEHTLPIAADLVAAAVVAGIAVAVRLPGLRVPSLWVDDVAPTLVIKAHGLRELLLVGTTYPGFVALLKGWLAVLGFSDTHALLLPFFGGVAACVVLYLAAVRRGLTRLTAFIAAAVLATSPAAVTYSTRVKPYATEALAAAIILAATARLFEELAEGRRWVHVVAACVAGTVLSGLVAVVAVPSIATACVAAWVCARGRRPAAASAAGFAAFLGVWWVVVLRHSSYATLRVIWRGYFIDVHDPATVGRAVVRTLELLSGVPPIVLGAVLVAGVCCIARRRPVYIGLLAGPFVLSLVLAAAGSAPIGTRGNLALLPGLAVLAGIGAGAPAAAILKFLRVRRATVKPAIAAAIAVALVACIKPLAYPDEDIKPLLAPMLASAREQYAVVVSSASALAFGLYTELPLRVVQTPEWFRVRITSPGLYVLPRYEAGTAAMAGAIETIEREHTRIWFVVSHGQAGDREVVRQLARDGYVPTKTLRADGAFAMRWDRRVR
jgi:hypothetical protein